MVNINYEHIDYNKPTNNFNLIRLFAAYLVLVSHCWPLFGMNNEPIHWVMGYESGGFLAVNLAFP
jgi:peptidoglycan/LPS O-acetylase OafA/YrhL